MPEHHHNACGVCCGGRWMGLLCSRLSGVQGGLNQSTTLCTHSSEGSGDAHHRPRHPAYAGKNPLG